MMMLSLQMAPLHGEVLALDVLRASSMASGSGR